MPLRTRHETLAYRNEAIVLRFQETWDVPSEEAQALFDDAKKWLWLCAYLLEEDEHATRLAITPSTKLVDEMWHTFILFTRDYFGFCERFLGRYIHHGPTPRSEYDATIEAYERDPESYKSLQVTRMEDQIGLVDRVLGEATVLEWYDEYVDKYSEARIRSIWRWSFSPYDTRVRESLRLATGGSG